MSYKQPGYLKQIWWTIKWFFIRNKRVETHSVTEPKYTPIVDFRSEDEFNEDLSDGALD